MKVKVATTFSFRNECKDGQNGERFVSSALTFEPDNGCSLPGEGCLCGTVHEAANNDCPGRALCAQRRSKSEPSTSDNKEVPKFMIIGKPCTGKTTLAKQLCDQFGCELINASELVAFHLSKPTNLGIEIDETLRTGKDLSDEIVLGLIQDKLQSESCKRKGYVLDGLPTHSESSMSIKEQLDYIFALENGPTYLIEIQISNEDLRTRWEDIRIDYLDGRLYSKESYDRATPTSGIPGSPLQVHPDFPEITEATKNRLLTRHEELPENLDKHFAFYDEYVEGRVKEFKSKHDHKTVISVDGRVTPSERFRETMRKLRSLSGHPDDEEPLFQADSDLLQALTEAKNVFGENPPRIVLLGKPSTGKTTLAKMLTQAWGCVYVNASELITRHLYEKTGRGLDILSLMQGGEDLSDILVFNIVNEEIQSPECREHGYILDGIPNYSEKLLTIPTQLEFLARVYPEPAYWITIDISDPELRKRWEAVRIDHATGKLYPKASYDVDIEPTGRCDFPVVDEETKNRLIIRHEELPENVELSFRFYSQHVEQPLETFLNRFPPEHVIRLDGTLCPIELGREFINKLNKRPSQLEPKCVAIKVGQIQRGITSTDFDSSLPEDFIASKEIWQGQPPRLVMVGKPCTGKTLLAKKLCQAWNCQYINSSELIAKHLENGTGRGEQILKILQNGEDLSDIMVFNLINEVLQSPECRESGYILDGLPNYSERLLNINTQLEFLARLYPPPYFWVDMDISDEELRARWETVRVDHRDGTLYSGASYDPSMEPSGRCEFPLIDEETKNRLLTRHEELPENLDQHFRFYNEFVSSPLLDFLERCSSSSVIYLDGTLCPMEMGRSLIDIIRGVVQQFGLNPSRVRGKQDRIRLLSVPKPAQNDGSDDSSPCLIRIKKRSTADTSAECSALDEKHKRECHKLKGQGWCCECGAKFNELLTHFWESKKPRFLIIGKPCTGKTTLARCLAETWGCIFVNASELIQYHMDADDDFGKQIKQRMLDGRDLEDALVIEIMRSKLESPECKTHGYIIDDFPTYSEKALSVSKQLEFLDTLNPGPEYVIDLQLPDELMRNRWETVRIDLESGNLLTPRSKHERLPPSCCLPVCNKRRPAKHGQLIKRHEELLESMDANINFYHDVVEPQLQTWVEKRFGDMVISVDADLSPDELFRVMQQKMRMIASNPSCPPRQLFVDKEDALIPGTCCRRCGTRYDNLEPLPDLWTDKPPRFVIFGKPCTGKTTLAKRLCTIWNCEFVNASDLIRHHLTMNTTTGQRIAEIFNQGNDLSDQFVIDMLVEKLNSPSCTENGYILEGIPTFSEKSKSIECQIECLKSLNPEYIINISLPDSQLRRRWELMRIDVSDGTLYLDRLNDSDPCSDPKRRRLRHPDFPEVDKPTKMNLITRHEELPEILDRHFAFQQAYISPRIRQFIAAHDQSKVITLDGKLTPNKMLNNVIHKLNVMTSNPNVSTKDLFDEGYSEDSVDELSAVCGCQKELTIHVDSVPELWLYKPPRIVILGKPFSGKSTLAKGLSTLWNCELISPDELIEKKLNSKNGISEQMYASLIEPPGSYSPLVMDVISEAISHPRSIIHGYILDGPPSNSSSVGDQLSILRSLPNGPEYVIELKISDEDLRSRLESSCLDTGHSSLYNGHGIRRLSLEKRGTRHPEFPIVTDETKDRLLAQVEDLMIQIDQCFEFYEKHMSEAISNFVRSHDPAAVVKVNANLTPSHLVQSAVTRLSIMAKHPGVPSSLLFRYSDDTCTADPDSTGCECQYGDRVGKRLGSNGQLKQTRLASVPNIIPRILILGHSCSGKTTFGKRLAKEWGCTLINASELISQHMSTKTPLGDQIQQIMRTGEDLSDNLVLNMLKEKLLSPECQQSGYILDDFPTSSEKGLNIGEQLNMLQDSSIRPDYVIDIQIPETDLIKRWEAVRIDIADGTLYPKHQARFTGASGQTHPVFPAPNENMKQRLMTRHEELRENIEKQSEFYRNYVRPQIDAFLKNYNAERIITIDGQCSIADMCQAVYKKVSDYCKESKKT